jgi:hypothetical protein
MQSQMESKLASLKSPGLKSGLPASPTTRNFASNRQSLILDNSSNFLSPDSAATQLGQSDSAAATLAQHRAKLKASNVAHRISAPVLASPVDVRASWGPSQLSQVSESQISPGVQDVVINNNTSRPKSTEFSGSLATPRTDAQEATASTSWASMVTTPLIPMFEKEKKVAPTTNDQPKGDWNTAPGVPRMGDPTIHRRNPKKNNSETSQDAYDDNGAVMQQNGPRGGNRQTGWNSRSPAPHNNNGNQANRFGEGPDGSGNNMNGLGMQMGGFGMGLGSPTLGMGLHGIGMQPMSPFNMNMLGMSLSPEAQLLAAQMAASGFGQPNWLGMQPMSPGLAGQLGPGGGRKSGPNSARSPPPHSARSVGSRAESSRGDEDVDPALLNDIPAWLRSLRLHKYTPNFEACKWQDMVVMDEAQLEAKGVSALGARRKMLKTFETVRKKMGIDGGPPSSAGLSSAGVKSP